MSRHESSGLEILLGLLFSCALHGYRFALFVTRTARNLADDHKARRAGA